MSSDNKSPDCLVVMYHYVRDLENSRYPGIKGLTLEKFRGQLDYLQKNYTPVSALDIHDCLHSGSRLPENACLLTFDDGYLEHYTEVFPELRKRGISGCFYPPVKAAAREELLNVNKIHLLLAHLGEDKFPMLLAELKDLYIYERQENALLPEYETLWHELAIKGRFDSAEVIFFKRLLQHALPEEMATRILDMLWDKFMDATQATLCRETYVSGDMLSAMAANSMHIGAHGASHRWLNKLPPAEQENEVRASLEFLREIYGRDDFIWSVAYPFGGVNESLKEICASMGASFGLTTVPVIGQIGSNTRFDISRMDTNDIFASSAMCLKN